MLPVTGLKYPNEKYSDEKIIDNNTKELYQKNNMLYHNGFNENSTVEKISRLTTNKTADYQTNTFPSFDNLTNRPILWEYIDNDSLPLVSICDNGKYIWVGQSLNMPRFQLFNTTGSGSPEWEFLLPEKDEILLIDSSTESCSVAGIVVLDYWTRPDYILFKWNVFNGTPGWNFDIPDDLYPNTLCVSNDGSRIVLAAYNQTQQIIKIFVFNSDSNTPFLIYPITVPEDYAYVYSLDVSYDGSIILVTCGIGSFVIDVNPPMLRWSGEHLPASISADGSILAYTSYENGNIITVLEWDSQRKEYRMKWQSKFTPNGWLIQLNGHTLTVSDDGSTILVGVNYKDFLENKVVLFDAENGNILWRDYSKGYGDLQNIVYEVKLSYNGSRAIVGYWGDDSNTNPVIKLYEKENTNPLLTIYSSGSTMSVDISSDGEFSVAGCKRIHANLYGYGGVIYAIDIKNKSNMPPKKPEPPFGQMRGKIGSSYNYSASTSDDENDKLFYLSNWGDGSDSGWLGPYKSGTICQEEHLWKKQSIYNITVKEKDIYGNESAWSDPLPITMPYSIHNPLQQFLEGLFQRFFHASPLLRRLMGY